MAIVRSVLSEKAWESLFQTLVKALRTQEVLVFENYSNNQECFLKQQEKITGGTSGRSYKSAYMRKLPKMSRGKTYKQYLLKHRQ